MNTRMLGRTRIEVGEMALGGLFVACFAGDRDQTRRAVHRALELGVNYIDTAPGYGNSEEVLGQVLESVERPLVLSTKLGGRPKPFDAQDADGLRASVKESLRLLKRDRIDILMVHEPDRPGQYNWWTDLDAITGPVLDVLDGLRDRGVIGFTGVAGTTACELARLVRTGRFDVVLTAFNYSLLWREAALEIIPAAKERDMGIVIGSPLQQGALARRFDERIEQGAPWLSQARREQFRALYALLDEIGMPLPELAMRFVVSNPDISCVLTGARSAEQVEENAAAVGRGPLPRDILERVDAIAAMVPFRPSEESLMLGWLLNESTPWRGLGPAR